jgi:molybdopterin-guanine dinucleotide biosynthesis protein A
VRGALLAGGRGTRMGGNKPLVEIAGRPLFMYALDAFQSAGLRTSIVAKPSNGLAAYEGTGHPPAGYVEEPEDPVHPLLGIATALESLGSPIVVCACDMPLVTGELLEWLAAQEGHDAVVCRAGGYLQPLLGRYGPALIDELNAAVAGGASGRVFVEGLGERARVVDEDELSRFGAIDRLLLDVDTPEAADEMARLLSARG